MRKIIEGYVRRLNQEGGVNPTKEQYTKACDDIELALSALPDAARKTALHVMKNPD